MKIFNQYAEDYFNFRPYLPAFVGDALVKNLNSPARVLEIGCGTGQATKSLANHSLSLTAIDIGCELIKYAKKHNYENLQTDFQHISFEDFESKNFKYDLIFSSMAFHWLDYKVAYKKTASLLKEDSCLALINIKRKYPENLRSALDPVYKSFPQMNSNRPSERISKSDISLERETYFNHRNTEEFIFDIHYTSDMYVGLMKTMSPQRSLSKQDQDSYYHKIKEAFDKIGPCDIPNLVSIMFYQKKSPRTIGI